MPLGELIPVKEFCIHHNIELSFIRSLKDYGLIEIIDMEENIFLPADQLSHLEKLVRLHYEMDINIEGIETISYLLERIKDLQQEITMLSNRLKLYEGE
jgi:chaperone modulatory protein CbpM